MILDPTARLAPTRVADAVAFEVGAESYTWDDIVLAATLWGEWQQVREQVRGAISFARDLQRREAAPSDAELESAADEFRYAHDLITAEETEAWLNRRGLDFDALLEYVERALARRCSALQRPPVTDEGPTDDEVEAVVWNEAVCSGWLGRLAGKLAMRAAVHEGLKVGTVSSASEERADTMHWGLGPHACPRHAESGTGLGRGTSPLQRFQWLQHLDQCFNQHCRDLVTPEATRAEMHLHQLDWVRVCVHYILLGSEDAAREAALCARQDGCTLDAAAERAGVTVYEHDFRLEEIDEAVRSCFLGARPNEMLGPLPWMGKHGIFLILEKRQACAEDPDAVHYARERLLARLLQHEVERHVRWLERF